MAGAFTHNGNVVEGLPSIASQINYDNTSSGMVATQVQAAIDELNTNKQPKTDNNLTTTSKETTGAINELKSGFTTLDNEVNGDATTYPYADVITIPDAVPANVADCSVKIEPVQDLHGYDKPWVGGAGKNKLPMTVDSIKALNTDGTWSGNSYTLNNITHTLNTDADGNIVNVTVNTGSGGASGDGSFYLYNGDFTSGDYIINGITGGNESHIFIGIISSDVYKCTNGDLSASLGNTINCFITTKQGSNVDKIITPMIRLATEADATFAPYTNICPISGHTVASVQRDGKNLFDYSTCENKAIDDNGMTWSVDTRLLSDFIAVRNIAYTVSIPSGIQFVGFASYDSTKAFVSRTMVEATGTASFTPTTPYIKLYFSKTDIFANISKDDVSTAQFERGSATAYTPYVEPKTYTIALGDTIYGGTVDFDSGVMTVDRRFVEYTDGTGWQRASSDPGMWFFCYPTGSVAASADFVTDKFDVRLPQTGIFNTAWIQYAQLHIKPDTNIAPSGATAEGLEEFKTWLTNNHLQVVYPLATPTTIQLTPQQIQLLQGQNILTASTGDISVTVNGVSGAIGAVQTAVNELAEQLPDAPTTDGAYVLTVTVADGAATYSWESAE